MILVNFEIFEFVSMTSDAFCASKNSPSNVIVLNPDLERCIAEGYSKNITIRYHTNGTVMSPKILQLWEQFKAIDVCISMDSWGKKNDYIRYPGNWNDEHVGVNAPGNENTATFLPLNIESVCISAHPYSPFSS